MQIYVYTRTPTVSPQDPSQPSSQLLLVIFYLAIFPKYKSRQNVRYFLHFTYLTWTLFLLLTSDICQPAETQSRFWFCFRAVGQKVAS